MEKENRKETQEKKRNTAIHSDNLRITKKYDVSVRKYMRFELALIYSCSSVNPTLPLSRNDLKFKMEINC